MQKARQQYLVAYNTFCLALWVLVGCSCLLNWHRDPVTWYKSCGPTVTLAMTLALLEIVHAAFRLVRSDPVTTMMQVLSRLHVCYLVWGLLPETRYHWAARLVIVPWTMSEFCRYPFYIYQLVNPGAMPYALRWLRYSAFIVLYPLGILGELVSMTKAVILFSENSAYRHWPIPMPNRFNFEINLSAVYVWLIIAYLPGSVHMFTHMLGQRQKALIHKS